MTRRIHSVLFLLLLVPAWADYQSDAEFRIGLEVVQPDPGPFTATIGGIPGDRSLFIGGEFEPLCFRTKVEAGGDSPDEIITGGWSTYRTFRSGFWDGAEVRVYRPRNGKLIKVRESHIATGGYIAEGWHVMPGFNERLVLPPVTSNDEAMALDDLLPNTERRLHYQSQLSSWPRGLTYWFCVTAVDAQGRESAKSGAASLQLVDPGTGTPMNLVSSFEAPKSEPEAAEPPSPPSQVKAMFADGLFRLSWLPSSSKKVLGYRLYVSDVAPEKQRGFHLRLADPPADPSQHLRDKDLVFLSQVRTNFSRRDFHHPWNYSDREGAYPIIDRFGDEVPHGSWSRVPHPQPLPPDFAAPGATCLQVKLDEPADFRLDMYAVGPADQTWYQILQPGVTYVAEAWAREDGTGGSLTFEIEGEYPRRAGIAPTTWQLSNQWRHYRTTFTPRPLYTSGPTLKTAFQLHGQGTFHLDNLRVYQEEPGYHQPHPLVVQRTRESGLDSLRFHTHIKSGWSQTMEMLTNAPNLSGVRSYDHPAPRDTLPALLDFCRRTGTNPWLQIEMCMSESEWLGLVEYLAAPYDPAIDSPQDKPWAAKRYAQGQQRPWIDAFSRLTFEISNETWNWLFGPWTFSDSVDEASGQRYRRGETYGMFQEYVLGILRQSPYWTPTLAAKFRSILGGWAIESNRESGYGPSAIIHSPSTDLLTIGGYNGGWDEGEMPAEMNDAGIFRSLTFWARSERGAANIHRFHQQLIADGKAQPFGFGTYEAGPGYALSGLNNQARMSPEQIEAQDQVGKSQATGVSTLDAFLGRAVLGYRTQNFFTLNFNRRYWTSHAAIAQGGHPFPSWLALQLYNTRGTGDFLRVEADSAPTLDLPGYGRRQARESAPMVSCYATRQGDQLHVFVLSRKLDGFIVKDKDGIWHPDFGRFAPPKGPKDMSAHRERPGKAIDIVDDFLDESAQNVPKQPKAPAGDNGYTPTTLHLPIAAATSVTLYKISGDPRRHNLDAYDVQITELVDIPFAPNFELNRARTGEARDGLPPGSVFLYVFDGIQPAGPLP